LGTASNGNDRSEGQVEVLGDADDDSYRRFATRLFSGGYQASRRYIDWLRDCPGGGAIWVVRSDREVVGCYHTFQAVVDGPDGPSRVSTFFNLAVADEHRGLAGFNMLRHALLGQRRAWLVPGVAVPELVESYRKLGGKPVASAWGRMIVPSAALRRVLPWRMSARHRRIAAPDAVFIDRIAASEDARAFLRWRLLHPGAPPTYLARVGEGELVFTVGTRKGMRFLRVIHTFGAPGGKGWLRDLARLARSIGAVVVLYTTINQDAAPAIFRPYPSDPRSFLFDRRGAVDPRALNTFCTDIGFDFGKVPPGAGPGGDRG
jgi:hypothetical protein